MNKMLSEINEIPLKAEVFLNQAPTFTLPLEVPYLGMGSSYFAPLAFKLMGIAIQPEIASEFFMYQAKNVPFKQGVILSQSGQSSEALWCAQLFEQYVAITNNMQSKLANNPNVSQQVDLLAGKEHYSSSKTYINTLLALFKGFGMDATAAVATLRRNMEKYRAQGEQLAHAVIEAISERHIHGIYIVGSGPNVATALQAALILSESTKRNFHGMAMAQYDHGPKETAANSIVIQVISKGPAYDRSNKLTDTITKAGATVYVVEEPEAEEHFSVLHNMVSFNYMGYYLAQLLQVGETFTVGCKVTEVV